MLVHRQQSTIGITQPRLSNMDKQEYERAWNAALEAIYQEGDLGYSQITPLLAPSKEFDEWHEREIANPPEGWEDHRGT